MTSEVFGLISGALALFGAPFYLFDILKGKTKPERTTWLIWSVLGVTAFVSQVKLGAHWSLLYSFLEAIGNLIVYGLSLKYGVGGWKRRDKLAISIALAGIIISLVLRTPILALCGVVLADISGAALTVIKAYRLPGSESTITWIFLGLAASLAAIAVGKLSAELLLYPVYIALSCFAVPVAQLFGKQVNRQGRRP